jgi:hypothetical protein
MLIFSLPGSVRCGAASSSIFSARVANSSSSSARRVESACRVAVSNSSHASVLCPNPSAIGRSAARSTRAAPASTCPRQPAPGHYRFLRRSTAAERSPCRCERRSPTEPATSRPPSYSTSPRRLLQDSIRPAPRRSSKSSKSSPSLPFYSYLQPRPFPSRQQIAAGSRFHSDSSTHTPVPLFVDRRGTTEL